MSEKDRKYTSVKIPKQLAKQIQDVMVERGFRSVADFVLFGTRQLLRAG